MEEKEELNRNKLEKIKDIINIEDEIIKDEINKRIKDKTNKGIKDRKIIKDKKVED